MKKSTIALCIAAALSTSSNAQEDNAGGTDAEGVGLFTSDKVGVGVVQLRFNL